MLIAAACCILELAGLAKFSKFSSQAAGIDCLLSYEEKKEQQPKGCCAISIKQASLRLDLSAAEQFQDHLTVLIGYRQRLHAQLLLHLERLESRGFVIHVSINQ